MGGAGKFCDCCGPEIFWNFFLNGKMFKLFFLEIFLKIKNLRRMKNFLIYDFFIQVVLQ